RGFKEDTVEWCREARLSVAGESAAGWRGVSFAASWLSSQFDLPRKRYAVTSRPSGRACESRTDYCLLDFSGSGAGKLRRLHLEPNRQAGRTIRDEALPRLPRLIAIVFKALESRQQIGQCDSRLQTCQRRAETEMDAVAKCDVRVGIAGDVKPVGMRKTLRVSVR